MLGVAQPFLDNPFAKQLRHPEQAAIVLHQGVVSFEKFKENRSGQHMHPADNLWILISQEDHQNNCLFIEWVSITVHLGGIK